MRANPFSFFTSLDTTLAYHVCQFYNKLQSCYRDGKLLELYYNEPDDQRTVVDLNLMSGRDMEIKARCYSGHIYAEEPRSLVWQGKELGIRSVEKAWQEPGKRLFKAVTADGKLFELCYNEATDQWSAVELMI